MKHRQQLPHVTAAVSTPAMHQHGPCTHRVVVEPQDGVCVVLVGAVSPAEDRRAVSVEPVAADVNHNEELEEKGIVGIDLSQGEQQASIGAPV